MSVKSLNKHLHFHKSLADAIPYRTTYYKKDWGFCVTQDQYQQIQQTKGPVDVFIDSNFKQGGSLTVGEILIPGESDEEILISTYNCHPSLANDNLSGGSSADTIAGGTGNDTINGGSDADILIGGAGDDEFDFASGTSTEASMDKITDYQAAAADNHNDKIDLITGAKGANSASIDVKSAIAGGGGGETVTASVTNGVATLSGSDKGLINTLAEWIDAVSVDGVIIKAADDADAIGVVVFELSGNTYLVESNDTFDNNTANVSIVTVIELEGLTGVTAVADAAAANTVLIA